MIPKGKVKLERALSKLGFCSRTKANEWIQAGRIKVNGVVRTDASYLVVPESAMFELDGHPLKKTLFRCILLHKPRGVVTTSSDEKNRPTVFSLLKENFGHLISVGRLDLATSGLLLLTNNTRLAAWLTDPKNEVPRTYVVTVRGEVTKEKLDLLLDGLEDEGETLKAQKVELRKSSGKESHLTIELREGKNREIRRMLKAIGHEVIRLKRTSFGALELGDLPLGHYVELSIHDLKRAFPNLPLF